MLVEFGVRINRFRVLVEQENDRLFPGGSRHEFYFWGTKFRYVDIPVILNLKLKTVFLQFFH